MTMRTPVKTLYRPERQMVGAIGFEPTTYGTQNRRATRLRHAPFHVGRIYSPTGALERGKSGLPSADTTPTYGQGQRADGPKTGLCT